MTHPTDNTIEVAKGIALLATSGVIYVADAATSALTNAPDWVTSLGLPVTMLFLAIAGLVKMHLALAKSNDARIVDQKENAKRWEDVYVKHHEKAEASRAKLIETDTKVAVYTQQMVEKIEELIDKK